MTARCQQLFLGRQGAQPWGLEKHLDGGTYERRAIRYDRRAQKPALRRAGGLRRLSNDIGLSASDNPLSNFFWNISHSCS
jgi:hypothetical protein